MFNTKPMPSFHLSAPPSSGLALSFCWLVIAESLSWLAFNFSILNIIVLSVLFFLSAFLVWKKPSLALYLSLAELFWGGVGHSFEWGLFNTRLVIFTSIFLSFAVKYGLNFRSLKICRDKKILYLWLAFIGAILVALVVAWSHHYSWINIFLDANAYLYLLYWPIWYQFYEPNQWKTLQNIFLASALVIALKTFLFFNLFVQQYGDLELYQLYQWLRDLRTGQITPLAGGFQRVFMPGQIYLLFTWFFIFIYQVKTHWSLKKFVLLSLLGAALFISMSRSFWLAGFSLILFLLLAALLRRKYIQIAKGLLGLSSLLLSFFLIETLFNLPAWKSYDIFANRTLSSQEPAANSRLELLPVMWQSVQDNPYLGQGFGKELTYRSSDPRIKNEKNPEGWQNTYALEWGWLDMWLKGGLLLLACFIAWFLLILKRARRLWPCDYFRPRAAISTVFLLALVQVFSPFLNHPLGLGPLMMFTIILSTYEEAS